MTALEEIKKTNHPDRIWATVNGMSTRLPDGARQLVGGWSQDADRAGVAEYVLASTLESLQRENEFLRDVAEKAIKLRRLGMALDDLESAQDALIKETNGVMSRSGTYRIMYESAFKTAMDDFDQAVLKAAEAHMDWAGRAALERSEG